MQVIKDFINLSLVALLLMIAACGGSSGDASTPVSEPSPSTDVVANSAKPSDDTSTIIKDGPTFELPDQSDIELHCDSLQPTSYLVNYYDIAAVRYEEAINDLTAYQTPLIIENQETIHWSTFSIQLKAATQTYLANNKSKLTFSLFAQANACSPLPPSAVQHLVSISIKSDNNFSDDYPAGAELAKLLAPVKFQNFLYPYDTIADINSATLPAPIALNMYLLRAPQYSRQNFTIEITLDDGNKFVIETGDIYFSINSISF